MVDVDFFNRSVGAALTFLAGWYWLQSEVDGGIWPLFAPALFMVGAVVFSLVMVLVDSLISSD